MSIGYKAGDIFIKWCEIKNKTKVITWLQNNNVEIYGGDSGITISHVYHYNIPNYIYTALDKFNKTDYKLFISFLEVLKNYD